MSSKMVELVFLMEFTQKRSLWAKTAEFISDRVYVLQNMYDRGEIFMDSPLLV